MKQYFTKYICDKDLVKDFWETENAINTMMDICHNTYTNILQDTESVFVNHS